MGVKRGLASLLNFPPLPLNGKGVQGDGVTGKNWRMGLK